MSAPISIINGQYSKNGGPYTSANGTIDNGDTLKVRTTSSPSFDTTTSAVVTVGSYSTNFNVTTKEEVGNEFRSQEFQRNDCPSGSSGTYYTYEVPANTYFAATLSEANALADADIAANGQNAANNPANGFCNVDTITSVLVVDFFSDSNIDVCGYIDTVGVAESGNIVARDGLNFFELTDEASSAYMLASDAVVASSLRRRFQFNIGRLLGKYPLINVFTFQLRGRSTTAGGRSGEYALKNPTQRMTMTGSAGSYIPSVTPTGGTTLAWSSNVIAGGNGTVGTTVGNLILTFTYDRANPSTVSITTY